MFAVFYLALLSVWLTGGFAAISPAALLEIDVNSFIFLGTIYKVSNIWFEFFF